MLDPALMRPGRLDRKVEIPLPNAVARKDILRIHSAKMQKQGEAALNNYYYIDPTTLESYAIYMSDYATGNADEIAMFQVKEENQVAAIKALINDRIADSLRGLQAGRDGQD